jgi:CubicO group peptidase (beta-lactamase class C family)
MKRNHTRGHGTNRNFMAETGFHCRRVRFCLSNILLTGFVVCCFGAWPVGSPVARADGDYVVLGGGNSFWTNNLAAPISKQLSKLQNDHVFSDVAFTPRGDWVVLVEGHGFYSSQGDLPACRKLSELQEDKNTFKCVAFTPTGGWAIFWNQNGHWISDGPEGASQKIQEVANQGGTLRSVAFGPHGAWVLLYDQRGVAYGNIPQDLVRILQDAEKNQLAIRCVAFTTTGTWFCLSNQGWWTSDLSHPASKQIGALEKEGKSPRWIAVAPEGGPHDFAKWSNIIHRALDGKLAGGYAFEVLQKGKVVAKGAEGWTRTPWEKQNPSLKWTLDKPMGVASVSKTVTAVALLKLWQETGQKFSLDDPFWPHIKQICPEAHADVKLVTVRQLLTHRSGFKPGDDYSKPEDLEKLLTQPLAHKPGAYEEYQNNNYYILRLIIEQIGHTQYTPYVKAQVLAPMGITHMETHFEAKEPLCGYLKLGIKRPGYPFDWNCDASAGAAGWYASAADLGRFLAGIREQKVLNPQTTEAMLKYNLGWDGSDPGWVKNGGWAWDEGSAPGSRAGDLNSAIGHFPDDVDAVLLANCDTPVDVEGLLVQAWRESVQK